ncbi:DUF4192 domain-containing protein [Catelliglobosispora koreensis]|uniref:DUF4192 domain-containing protein n=1 Tax=Catelliglobosispora koreensis TaxID=129052 RepID=UPI0012FABF56|nr:DUF4192 domain-containing protein [Catelliglobosispora koreensis]
MTVSIRIGCPEDLLGYVPFALGYHPQDSIVLLAVEGGEIRFTARADAAAPTRDLLRQLRRAVRLRSADSHLTLIAYGGWQVRAAAESLLAELTGKLSFQMDAAMWVEGERFYCLLCDNCSAAGGKVFDFRASSAAASAVAAGLVARSSREEAVGQLRPLGGLAAVAMTQAVDRAEVRLGQTRSIRALVTQGKLAVNQAFAIAKRGDEPSIDEVAWLSVVLADLTVRDHAWERTDGEDWQFQLWLGLSRRAKPVLAAPITTLLGWCCYRRGDGLLAGEALRRALCISPDYSLAGLLLAALQDGQPPSAFSPWPPRK